MSTCSRCAGVGAIECSKCVQTGQIYQFQPIGFGAPDCPKCKGFGYIDCSYCQGLGKLPQISSHLDVSKTVQFISDITGEN